jgi:hypothetical protein
MKNSFYHLAKLITKIDETKLIENIKVAQGHDRTTRWLAGSGIRDSVDDDAEPVMSKLIDVSLSVLPTSWSP